MATKISPAAEAQHAKQRGKAPRIPFIRAVPAFLIFLAWNFLCASRPGFRDLPLPRSPEKGAGAKSQTPGRALWVWHPDFLHDPARTASFFEFVEAKQIITLFLSVPMKGFSEESPAYSGFLGAAHGRRLTVEALNGDPEWVLPAHQAKALEFIDAVVRFNAAGAPEERFDGAHLDIEPQALPEWKGGGKKHAALEYLELLAALRQRARKDGIRLALDIPFGFNHIEVDGATLTERVMGLADEVALMAYRSRPDQVLRSAEPAVEAADKGGVKVWVGISAKPEDLIGNGSGLATGSYLENLCAQVEAAFKGRPSFGGIAIHDFRRYRDLGN